MTRQITSVLISAVIIMIFAGFAGAGKCPETIPGLVSYWQLDESSGVQALDLMETNDGVLFGHPVWTTGQINGALEFDGIDDYITIPDDDSLTPGNTITLSFWTYYKGDGAGIYKYAGCPNYSGSPDNSRAYYLQVNAGTDKATLRIFSTASNYDDLESNTSLSIDTWHHVAATFSYGQAAIYIDGQLDNSTTMTVSSIMNDAQVFSIGGFWSYCHGRQLISRTTGKIDDVAIFDRALSPDEIWQSYQDGLEGLGYPIDPLTVIINKNELIKTLKNDAIESVTVALNKEKETLTVLNELLECDDLGDLKAQDIHHASRRIHQAIQHQENIIRELTKSLEDIEDAMEQLGREP